MNENIFYVNCLALNVRTSPEVKKNNIKTVLHQNDKVIKIEDSIYPWVKISSDVCIGYVSSLYLHEEKQMVPESNKIESVHLSTDKIISRYHNWGRAYPLDISERPTRDKNKIGDYYEAIKYLDVENAERYQPTKNGTACNIYAHDFALQFKTHIPRVWWTDWAINEIRVGKTIPIEYGKTVREMSANSLYDWFVEWGELFGWVEIKDGINKFQIKVNEPIPGIISAKNKNLKNPGHITFGIPEHEEHNAIREDGYVIKPLQTQAGGKNKMLFADDWFMSRQFSDYGFWIYRGV